MNPPNTERCWTSERMMFVMQIFVILISVLVMYQSNKKGEDIQIKTLQAIARISAMMSDRFEFFDQKLSAIKRESQNDKLGMVIDNELRDMKLRVEETKQSVGSQLFQTLKKIEDNHKLISKQLEQIENATGGSQDEMVTKALAKSFDYFYYGAELPSPAGSYVTGKSRISATGSGLCFGPYLDLPKGKYQLVLKYKSLGLENRSKGKFDIVAWFGKNVGPSSVKTLFEQALLGDHDKIVAELNLEEDCRGLEARVSNLKPDDMYVRIDWLGVKKLL